MRKFSKINENGFVLDYSEYHYIDNQEIIDVFQDLLDCDYKVTFSNMYMDVNGGKSNKKNIFKSSNPYTDISFRKYIAGGEDYFYDGSIRFKENSDEIIIFHECVLRLRIMYPKLKFLTSQRDGSVSDTNHSNEFIGLHLRIVYDKVENTNKINPSEAKKILDNFEKTLIRKIDYIDLYYFKKEQHSDYFLLVIRVQLDSAGMIGRRLIEQNKQNNKETILSIRDHLIEYCKKHLPDYTVRVRDNNIRYDQDIVVNVKQKRNFLMDKIVPKDITLYLLEIAIDF